MSLGSRFSAGAAIVGAALGLWAGGEAGASTGRTTDEPGNSVSTALPALQVQVLLDRAGFSPGVIDGHWGPNTKRALDAYQRHRGLASTGEADPATLEALGAAETSYLARYRVTRDDLDGPFVASIPEGLEAQAELDALLYTSAAEALAERFHTLPKVLAELNRENRRLKAGRFLRVPAVRTTTGETRSEDGAEADAARLVVSRSQLSLTVEDGEGQVLFYAPVTAGSEHDPLPIGDWKVVGVALDPVFHYDPDLFWDADPADEASRIEPGPNNPVGRVWIDLDKDHYGIHGTPSPEEIGRALSHGCVRLTNWDALEVAARVRPGMPVAFRE